MTHTYVETLTDLTTGARVELHPACDAWIMGDRFGTIAGIGRKYASVKMDRSERTRKLPAHLLRLI